MARTGTWLEPFAWEIVTAQNAVLCEAKNAVHKPTSDGHDATRDLWEHEIEEREFRAFCESLDDTP